MEKLTVVSNFVKSIDLLRNTECSQKEKLQSFRQISDCIVLPSLISNENFSKHVSSAISVLLFFCEDLDSVVRMSAEENLNRIVRSVESTRISRVLIDLYGEIKKNGNQKSLRICLNLFAYYCPRIKEKNVKWYALKLLPCLQAIAQRKETLLIETLAEFMKSFGQCLQICLNDNETLKLMEIFLADIISNCAVKRRCASQCCMHLIQNSRNQKTMAKHGLNKALDYLPHGIAPNSTNNIIGVLGFLRLLLPITISLDICDSKQIIEIYDLCLHLLNNSNHSTINASLEVINSILSRPNRDLEELLISHHLHHNEILKRRKSLKNQIFQLKSSGVTCPASLPTLNFSDEFGVGGDGDGIPLNKLHLSRKSSTETIKDAFKSESCTDEHRRRRIEANAGHESMSSSSNEIKVVIDCDDDKNSSDRYCRVVVDVNSDVAENDANTTTLAQVNELHEESHLNIEDKSQILSDVDNESFNSIDFESEITIGTGNDDELKKDDEKADVKSLKSTDSIGSFFNSLLSHSNAESMTKLFRPSTKLSGTTTDSSTTSTLRPKTKQSEAGKVASRLTTAVMCQQAAATTTAASTTKVTGTLSSAVGAVLTLEDDTISLESINSHISLSSHVSLQSGTQDLVRNEQDLVLVQSNDYEIEKNIDVELSSDELEVRTVGQEDSQFLETVGPRHTTKLSESECSMLKDSNSSVVKDMSFRSPDKKESNDDGNCLSVVFDDDNIKLDIGTIYEQNIIYYTVRLISSHFLLSGSPGGLVSDTIVRVSIKNLSLNVLANCVKLKPEVLQLSLEIDKSELPHFDISSETSNDNSSSSNEIAQDFDMGDQFKDMKASKEEDVICSIEENLLEIKDDHFGESTNSFLFNSPLSKSADHVLLTQLKKTTSSLGDVLDEKQKYDEHQHRRDDENSRLNYQLKQILSKSEIIESVPRLKQAKSNRMLKPPTPSTALAGVVPLKVSVDSKSNRNNAAEVDHHDGQRRHHLDHLQRASCTDEDSARNNTRTSIELNHQHHHQNQFIHDVFLYSNHSDPVLRGNMQIIAGNFIQATLSGSHKEINCATNSSPMMGPLHFEQLLKLLIKGFRDEIHTVVIQALTSFDKVFLLLMSDYYNNEQRRTLERRKDIDDYDGDDDDEQVSSENEDARIEQITVSPKLLLNQLQLCYENKYWLVQNKYADIISNLDFEAIREYYGDDIALTYEDTFLQQLVQLLGDDDARVRDHVAECLCEYVEKGPSFTMKEIKATESNRMLLEEFLFHRVFRAMSNSLCDILKKSHRRSNGKGRSLLSRILFLITNRLMELDKKNMQFGIINAIRILLNEFNPIDYLEIWNEFNLLEICLCFTYQNYTTATDIHIQKYLIEINAKFLAANILTGNTNCLPLADNLFEHIMKILNIYYYLFSNQKPMMFIKAQKPDLFANTKEFSIHQLEYVGCDYLYFKLYNILKAAHDNYKITINCEAGNKLMSLVAVCLNTLSLLLELKQNVNTPNSIKFIEEILQYLTVLVNYSPIEAIGSLRQLLKFLFSRNYGNRKHDYENFMKLYFNERNSEYRNDNEDMNGNGVDDSLWQQDVSRDQLDHNKDTNVSLNFAELFASGISFPLGKSKFEEDCAKHIKLFEPLVIYCLTLFMKSNATVQAPILDMLSQLLEFNVTYSILDSKNVIFDQVENNIELIESGTARNSTILIRPIIKFLVKLTKQNDKKLISIPKIISITNNLFANNALHECSVIALKDLAFEIFFTRSNSLEYSSNTSLNNKELNTQREVILRMLEQFISSLECQKMLAILLLWNRTPAVRTQESESIVVGPASAQASIQDEAILSIVTSALQNGKIVVDNSKSFSVLDSILRNCDENILLGSDVFDAMLALFMKRNTENFNNLSHAIIILDNVILKTEQIYLVNHVKLFLVKNNVVVVEIEHKNRDESLTNDEINYFAKVLYSMLETCFSTSITYPYDKDYCFLTSKYMRCLILTMSRFDKVKRALRTLFMHNDFYSKFNVRTLRTERVKFDILNLLCELCLAKDDVDATSVAVAAGNKDITLTLQLLLQYAQEIKKRDIRKVILTRICEKFNNASQWTRKEMSLLLGDELLLSFLEIERSLQKSLTQHEEFSTMLIENLNAMCSSLSMANIPHILRVLSTFNPGFMKLKFLWNLFIAQHSNRSVRSRIQSQIEKDAQSLSRSLGDDLSTHCLDENSVIVKTICSKRVPFMQLSSTAQNAFHELSRLFHCDDLDDFAIVERNCEDFDEAIIHKMQQEINEKWLIQQVVVLSSQADPIGLTKILMNFKSEIKLKTIFGSAGFYCGDILGPCLDISFQAMITSFQNNCVQYNPHINYMNINPLLKVTLNTLIEKITAVIAQKDNDASLQKTAISVISLMRNLEKLESTSMIYIKPPAIEKFILGQLLKAELPIETLLINFALLVANYCQDLIKSKKSNAHMVSLEIGIYCRCLDAILKQKFVWSELNQPEKYGKHLNEILNMIHDGMTKSIRNTIFYKRYWMNSIGHGLDKNASGKVTTCRDEDDDYDDNNHRIQHMQKAIFLAKLIESKMDGTADDTINSNLIYGAQLMKTFKSIAISLLRTNYYYGIAVIPHELLHTYGYDRQVYSCSKLPSIPVDHLSDVDILQKFVKRLSIFGFSTRQQFEEYFMTFLLLINRVYDENMVDEQEQCLIKNSCLAVIIELLLMCRTFPVVGNKLSMFHHTTRWSKIKCKNNISLKKLHKVQLIIPGSNVFYHPNLERDLSAVCHDSIIGTNYFLPNQYELNHVWQQMENLSTDGIGEAGTIDGEIKEDTSGIDLKSSCQLIFDVFTQIIEQNHVLVLPNLVKFCDICYNRDHIRWIKNTMLKLQEQIPVDDTISHQHIIYLLCRTQSILVPSYTELSHLCSIISTYLKSTHVFIRNATLQGLLCLLECCSKTSTTMGKLSEELCLLRDIIVGYITRHGIIEESSTIFSDIHTKLVWTLNFSLIEMTTKFVPECHLLSNTIISANNLLKRTSNEAIYLCIIHGLERIIVVNSTSRPICDKVEKLALELVKLENERFSLPALKLLISCVYMGSSNQLETTEHSNGIVQDDPEIIAQQTEKVDVLLHRIKSSTSSAAKIYGEVLCQIIRDLVPPNEILTKVIKEFLAINQPHCEVIARIVYQVFRSCIDSSFLHMLQDWLICSLPNFVTMPAENGVWCLTVIFLSASINLDLIKLFPFILNEFKVLNETETLLFTISARDFYLKLNAEQRMRFKEVFANCELSVYKNMLKCL